MNNRVLEEVVLKERQPYKLKINSYDSKQIKQDIDESNEADNYKPFLSVFLEKPIIPSPYMMVDSMFPTWCKVFGVWAPDDW